MKNKIDKNYNYYVSYLKSKRFFDDKVLEFPSATELGVWSLYFRVRSLKIKFMTSLFFRIRSLESVFKEG